MELPYEVLSALYEDPTDLSVIADPRLRMQARSIIKQVGAAGSACVPWDA